MSRSTGRYGRTLVTAVMALGAFLGAAQAKPTMRPLSNARLRQPRDRAFVTSAIRGAARRLGDPRCQDLLGELRDSGRRPLREALEAERLERPGVPRPALLLRRDGGGLRRPEARVHGARLPRGVGLQQPVPRRVPAEHEPGRGRGHPRGAPLPRPRREPSLAAGDQRQGAGGVPGVKGRAGLPTAPWSKRLMDRAGRSGSWSDIQRPVHAPLGRNTARTVRGPRPPRGRGHGRGLPRPRPAARPRRRGQGPARRRRRRPRPPRAASSGRPGPSPRSTTRTS